MNKRMEDITQLASELGLDPFPVIFETIEQLTMHNICAYGLPTRARHWSYGRSYDHQKTYGEMGFSKVYEVILNNNPSYAFMMDTNSEVQNLFITAHCLAHSDFFKNNCMFYFYRFFNFLKVTDICFINSYFINQFIFFIF